MQIKNLRQIKGLINGVPETRFDTPSMIEVRILACVRILERREETPSYISKLSHDAWKVEKQGSVNCPGGLLVPTCQERPL